MSAVGSRWRGARWNPMALAVLAGMTGVPTATAGPPSPPRAAPVRAERAARTAAFDDDRRIDVNLINMFVTNNGTFAGAFTTGLPLLGGLIYPRGTAKSAVFVSGLWLGCKVRGEIRTTVGSYSSDFSPGAIVGGTFDDPGKPEHRVYKMVRFTGDPRDTLRAERTAEELAADPALDPVAHHSWTEYRSGAVPYGAPSRLYRLPDTSTPAPDDSLDVIGPDVIGDQMLWCVYNDADPNAHAAFQTTPLGAEVQQATFAFDRQGALGSTVFLRFTIINKGPDPLDSLYVSLWSDPDLGDYGDDLVGCDSTLSLGFAYNANNNDRLYGATPPAVGYDFFLGPVDRATGDTLRLASFNKYISGTDPFLPGQVYNYMRGINRDGTAVIDPTTGQPTRFFHPGDPVLGSGWLDSNPSDRRFLLSAGPVTMAPGDTQVVVGAILVGQGTDRLSSISALKFFDTSAQDAFDRGFDLPSPPPQPAVSVAVDHGAVTLCWDATARTAYAQAGYAFQGYNVYQGASAAGPWKRIATYDEVDNVRVIYDEVFDLATGQIIPQYPVAFGSDNGIRFCHATTQDAIRGGSLRDATDYFFAVTAYAYGPGQHPNVLENSIQAIRVMPRRPAAGTDPRTASALPVEYRQADPSRLPTSDRVTVEVVNPAAVTGHTYQVSFHPLVPPITGQVGADTATVRWGWDLTDLTTGQVLLSRQINRRGDDDYQVVHGLRVREVGDYFPHLRDAVYLNHNPAHDDQWGAGGLPFFFGGGGAAWDLGDGVTTALNPAADPDSFLPVEIRFGANRTQKAYRFLRLELADASSTGGPGDPPPGGRGYQYGGFHDVPFTVWDTATETQLEVAFTERTLTDSTGTILPPAEQPTSRDSTWALADAGDGGREIVLPLRRQYSGNPDPATARDAALADGSLPLLYALAMGQNPFSPGVDDGDSFAFLWATPASPNDTMRFETRPLVRADAALARSRLDRIRVVPNPYYNQSRYELSPTARIVRFINMPEVATVRVYTLAGHLARTLRKSDPTTSVLDWDLLTDSGLPVASGVYIYQVDSPGVGMAVGRMAVFMEKERLTSY